MHHIHKLREQKGIVEGRNNYGSDLIKIKNLLNSKFKIVMGYLSGEKGEEVLLRISFQQAS